MEQFLEDIDTALKNNEPDYFIGLIVLVEPEENASWQILDGQQRLASSTMIYSAIRNWLIANGFEKDGQKGSRAIHRHFGVGEEKDRSRIALNVKGTETYLKTQWQIK